MDKNIEIFKNKKIFNVENIFLILALVFGLAIVFIGTPIQESDGWEHFIRGVDVSYGNLFSPVILLNHDDGQAVVPENFGEVKYRLTDPGTNEGKEFRNLLKSIKPSKNTIKMTFYAGTMSVFYYPQALGVAVARLLGLSIYGWVIFGRIFNLLIYLAFAYTAIRITPILKNTMVVIALLPMSLYQAASFSPDSMLNGLCFLFAALVFYYAYGDKQEIRISDVIKLGILLAFIFLCKYVYVALGLLVFIIPKNKFGDKKEYIKKFIIGLIPVLIFGIIAVYAAVSAITSGAESANERIIEGTSAMTPLEFLLGNPVNIIKLLIYSFLYKLTDYVYWLDVLGSLNYQLGPLIYIIPAFVFYVVGSEINKPDINIRVRDKILTLIIFFIIYAGIVIGIYVGDTRINFAGELVVQGVQGRYFIAALPMLAFAFVPRKRKNEDEIFSYKLLLCEFFILCIMVYFLKINCL
ncbi:MAG: DUF2142 domain-containing protein [Lachnospiraceae bacterium]|nr:DUF2142 domain-containing protein [Lachnospiraceae bacterium]